MDNGLGLVILLMCGSHDMRHTGFHKLTVINKTSRFGVSHIMVCKSSIGFCPKLTL